MYPIGCLSHPGEKWDSAAQLGGVVARIVMGPTEGQAVLGDVVYFLSLSTV